MRKGLFFAILICCLGAGATGARSSAEKILPLDGRIAEDGRSVELNWFDATPPRVGSVTVKRRLYGQLGGETWQTIATGLGPVMRYTDNTVKPGVAYEYQVLRTARDIVDLGYWLTGTDLPARAQRGNAYMIVDETIAGAIGPRLDRFERDLIGDGWQVQRHEVPRGNRREPSKNLVKALKIKEWLKARYAEDPFGQHSIILVGHVPIMPSGKANPDGHSPVPHPTDLFYADMDGRWTATREGALLDNRVPGDFIEMQIGRIDFSNHTYGDRDLEARLLRAYLDKNHHWRMGYLGDLREAYAGNPDHLSVEAFGLRNVVGPAAVTKGGHHDVGEEHPWLWGVSFGDFNGYHYAEKYRNKAVFAINFGSGKQMVGSSFNPMSALLAQPWYTVAVGWGARPAWWPHHMALGGSIGDVQMRTVNNGRAAKTYRETMDYFPTGNYLWRNPVWVNLLGDPTLRGFPVAPARNPEAQPVARGMKLSWQASPDADVLGYQVLRAEPDGTTFTALNGLGDLVTGLEFTDRDPWQSARYMVRAYGRKQVHAGSFYAFAQGAFSADRPVAGQKMVLETPAGQSLRLPEVFNRVIDGRIHAIIEGPTVGEVTQDGENWQYTPPPGFAGSVDLRFSVSDGWRRWQDVLTIQVAG